MCSGASVACGGVAVFSLEMLLRRSAALQDLRKKAGRRYVYLPLQWSSTFSAGNRSPRALLGLLCVPGL